MSLTREQIKVGAIIKITKKIVIGDQTGKLCDVDLNEHLLLITDIKEYHSGFRVGADVCVCDFIVISENKNRHVKNFMFYFDEIVIWSD